MLEIGGISSHKMTFFKKVFGVMKFSAKESFTYRFNFIIDLLMLPVFLVV